MNSAAMNKQAENGDFNAEYEVDLEQWLRRRFRNLCIGYLVFMAWAWFDSITLGLRSGLTTYVVYTNTFHLLETTVVLYFLFVVRPRLDSRRALTRSATQLVNFFALCLLVGLCVELVISPETFGTDIDSIASDGLVVLFTYPFFLGMSHLFACLFLPWTGAQSLKAMAPAFILWVLISSVFVILSVEIPEGMSLGQTLLRFLMLVVYFGFTTLVLVPGLIICWIRLRRHGRRFRINMVGRQFVSLRRELQQARRIHDALFPAPHADGQCRFDYAYQPQTDLGGDFIWFERTDDLVRMLLIDVTGHGLSAAMTVNRIHGEIQRIIAENRAIAPEGLMSLLDRYFVLTLAPHNVFATGLACELDLRSGRLRWVNAGHPPAFVLGSDGETRELESTAMMLGVQGPDDFEANQSECTLEPGSMILAYTDGVIEARDPRGVALGLDRLRGIVGGAEPTNEWTSRLLDVVNRHARKALDDDVLVVSLAYTAAAEATPSNGGSNG